MSLIKKNKLQQLIYHMALQRVSLKRSKKLTKNKSVETKLYKWSKYKVILEQ